MRPCTPLYDFFVISTGSSRRQIHTVAEESDAALRAEGDTRLGIEGYEASKWVVQDYGDVVIHVFDPDTRDYYKLEELWSDAPRVDWEREI
jgi:ribosome-associated protein